MRKPSSAPGTGHPHPASTGNPGPASMGSPAARSSEEEFLYFFSCPVLTDNDLAQYFRLRRHFGGHPDFDRILHAERKNFDDYINLLLAVRIFHGKAANQENKTHREAIQKDPQQERFKEIRRITENQKTLAAYEEGSEKEGIAKVTNLFKGRFLREDSPALPQDWKGHPRS